MLKGLMDWYLAKLSTGGYPLIMLLMAIESSIVPLPSELIIPPAAHLAYTHQAGLGIVGIIIAGTVGSWLGASLMYWVSRIAGRPLVLRFGRYFLISPEKVRGAERWASHYRSFSIYTILGSCAWCGVLCYIGFKMGQDRELMRGEAHRISIWLGGAMLVLGGIDRKS